MSVSVETKRRFGITRLEERIAPSTHEAVFMTGTRSHSTITSSSHKSHKHEHEATRKQALGLRRQVLLTH